MAGPGTAPQLAGGAMEGKEVRFGEAASALFAAATTGTSTGAVNSMHDSMTAPGGGVVLFNMMLGEIAPGGVGSGLYGMLMLAIVTVFLAGLMVGRTPEYLGKKISQREIVLVAAYVLATPVLLLAGIAVAVSFDDGPAGILNSGAHGFSEMLYAVTSASNNNGSAFGGLTSGTPFWNTLLGLLMLFGRFLPMVFVLALAGRFAAPSGVPAGTGTLPTHRPLFVAPPDRRRARRRRSHLRARALPRACRGVAVVNAPETTATRPHGHHPDESSSRQTGVLTAAQLLEALPGALRKLDPRQLLATPVMLVVEARRAGHDRAVDPRPERAGLVRHGLALADRGLRHPGRVRGRGPRQGPGRQPACAADRDVREPATEAGRRGRGVPSTSLRVGDVVLVAAGERIPGDGEVIQGVASVDESAVTGESAPVIRESGGDRSAVTGGTTVLSDRDRRTDHQRARPVLRGPDDRARRRLRASAHSQRDRPQRAAQRAHRGVRRGLRDAVAGRRLQRRPPARLVLVALLVCLIPTTIGALLSAIGIAGMDRLVRRNVLAMSGRAVEAAGDIDVLLLDKTGTITLGNRHATELLPLDGVSRRRARRGGAARLAGRRDPRGPQHRRAGPVEHGGIAEPDLSRRHARRVLRHDADEWAGHAGGRTIRKGAALGRGPVGGVDRCAGVGRGDLAARRARARRVVVRRYAAGGRRAARR